MQRISLQSWLIIISSNAPNTLEPNHIKYLFVSLLCVSVEIATLVREDGQSLIKILPASKLTALIEKHEAEEAKAEAEKKKEKASS